MCQAGSELLPRAQRRGGFSLPRDMRPKRSLVMLLAGHHICTPLKGSQVAAFLPVRS